MIRPFLTIKFSKTENNQDVHQTQHTSYNSGFVCANNKVIPIEKRCNGVYDCKFVKPIDIFDLSDERNCCKFFTHQQIKIAHSSSIAFNDFSGKNEWINEEQLIYQISGDKIDSFVLRMFPINTRKLVYQK